MNTEQQILYEDEDYIALNKPSGMLVIPGRFDASKENLYALLGEKYGKIWIVHRLDRDTSGAVVFAKNAEAHRELSKKWEEREVEKKYLAIVRGSPEKAEARINKPIAPLKKKKGIMVVDEKKGKKSVTGYRVVEKFKDYTLLEVVPKTGRTHQIRVHMAWIGHPVAGDRLYDRPEAMGGIGMEGVRSKLPDKAASESSEPSVQRLMLHARSLSFTHYKNKSQITIEAGMPADMDAFLLKLKMESLIS